LGFYQMAYRISSLPATELTHVVSQVAFPAYSKLQDRPVVLRNAYLRMLQFVAFFSTPLAVGIFLLAPEMVRVMLGPKWTPIIPILRLLAVWGFMRALNSTATPLFRGVGIPRLVTQFTFVKMVVMLISLYPLTKRFGLMGTSLSIILASLIADPIAHYYALKITHCTLHSFSKPFLIPLLGASGMFISTFSIHRVLSGNSLAGLMLLLSVGSLTYLALSYTLDKILDHGLRENLVKSFAAIKGDVICRT
jgi:O-antigen/teichoic acid export membrane protein